MSDYTIDISIVVKDTSEGKIISTFKSEILSDDTISKIFEEVDAALISKIIRFNAIKEKKWLN